MRLAPGSTVGPYEIVSAIGAGGMGEVYRAIDQHLHRDVAIKVLPELFARDPERLARFEREARTLAALNHTNIAHIYGVEALPPDGGTQGAALVMEFVDGEDLAQRIARGAIPVEEAIPIASQIAEALEAAHEQGFVHRDLKPANIKLRPDGLVKVLDFGLAKALAPPDAGVAADATNSPTITSPFSLSALGVILGTAAYMAPEQAKGRTVDKRADIWAFGCVLYEMLTGQRAFKGEDASDTLAAVLRQDVDLSRLPPGTPGSLRQVIARCLQRDPKQRLRDIGDARIELARLESGAIDAAEPRARITPAASRVRLWLPWSIAVLATAALIAALVARAPWRREMPPAPIRLSAEIGVAPDAVLDPVFGAAATISPDGRLLAFAATTGPGRQLFVRQIDQLQARPLSGTDGASSPFFSPDGQSIAFFTSGALKRVPVIGGAPVTICAADVGRGGWWADDDTIVLQAVAQSAPLMRVPASGGPPTRLAKLEPGEAVRRWPQVLPGSKAVLYTSNGAYTGFDTANIVVQPLDGGAPKVIVRGGFYGRYVASGHVLYIHENTLFALPFDLSTLEGRGRAVPAVEDVLSSVATGGGQYAVSDEGTLVFSPGHGIGSSRPIVWMNRKGATEPLRTTEVEWYSPRFAPDGRQMALAINESGQQNIWTYDWSRDTTTKRTFDSATNYQPVWTPDGMRIIFSSDRAVRGVRNLYWLRADGTGDVQRLTDSPNNQVAWSVHPSGTWVAFSETRPGTLSDLMLLPLEGSEAAGWKPGKPTEFLDGPANQSGLMFSPDGRWLAYMASDSGAMQIYVRPFPGPGGRWQISSGSVAIFPVWSRVHPELLYLDPSTNRVMFSSYTIEGNSFHADTPRPWSPTPIQMHGNASVYDLHPDGERIATDKPSESIDLKRNKVEFVFNFFELLRRSAPPGGK